MEGEGLEHLSHRDREILGMEVAPEEAPEHKETTAKKVGEWIGSFILASFLLAFAAIVVMFLVKCVLLTYGWLF